MMLPQKISTFLFITILSACAPNFEVQDAPYSLLYTSDENQTKQLTFDDSTIQILDYSKHPTLTTLSGHVSRKTEKEFEADFTDSSFVGTFTKSKVSDGAAYQSPWVDCPNVQLYNVSIIYPAGSTTVVFEGNRYGCR